MSYAYGLNKPSYNFNKSDLEVRVRTSADVEKQEDPNMATVVEGGFSRFCQLTLIVINIVALVKSIEMTFCGGTLLVLDPAFNLILKTINLTSSDQQSEVTAPRVLHLSAVFFLSVGPVLFIVGAAGLAGAYRKSNGWLAVYLGLLVCQITIMLVLCTVGLPQAIVDPNQEWRPLSDFLLTAIVFSLALQGVMIFFTIVVMSASAREDGQVHPRESQTQDTTRYRKNRPPQRPNKH